MTIERIILLALHGVDELYNAELLTRDTNHALGFDYESNLLDLYARERAELKELWKTISSIPTDGDDK